MDNVIFQYKTPDGLRNLQFDTVKLLIEDEEFFAMNIPSIQQNSYDEPVVRIAIGILKDFWQQDGLHLTYDGLLERGLAFLRDNIDKEELVELVRILKDKTLSERRVAELKAYHKYWRLFVLTARTTNHIKDAYDGGIPNQYKLMEIAKRAVADIKEIEEELRLLDNNARSHSAKNDW